MKHGKQYRNALTKYDVTKKYASEVSFTSPIRELDSGGNAVEHAWGIMM